MQFEQVWSKVDYRMRSFLRQLDNYNESDLHEIHELEFQTPRELFSKALQEGFRSEMPDAFMEVLSELVRASKRVSREDLMVQLYPEGEQQEAQKLLERIRLEALEAFDVESQGQVRASLEGERKTSGKLERLSFFLSLVRKDLRELKSQGKL